ncbi:Hypothetical predicted protein [Podarcis lilfordi]|uniref:Uncharacterized protein n=1 Tax=Podarcis lilfordi TaxID=74358 RepID=A0AA35KRI4_9SAUR|nr:Hypothetical predicted protein [Podarcis lilfordi]
MYKCPLKQKLFLIQNLFTKVLFLSPLNIPTTPSMDAADVAPKGFSKDRNEELEEASPKKGTTRSFQPPTEYSGICELLKRSIAAMQVCQSLQAAPSRPTLQGAQDTIRRLSH